MASIASARQVGAYVEALDSTGHLIFSKNGTLVGFTSSSITVQGGPMGAGYHTYGADGHHMFTKLS